MNTRTRIIGLILILLLAAALFIFLRYFLTYEQRNRFQRNISTVTGQNLTVTIFGYDGRIIKRWTGVQKITSGQEERSYTYFYTRDKKYVQIPDSVWYLAEEE
jgi:hypothetical protein